MRSSFAKHGRAALVLLLALSACADFTRGDYWELDDEAGDAGEGGEGEFSYATDIHPLMDSGCERCHGPGNSAGNTGYVILSDDVFGSHTMTLDFVDVESPGDSRLLSKMAGAGHGGGTIFDDRSPEYDLVLAWIEQGAPP